MAMNCCMCGNPCPYVVPSDIREVWCPECNENMGNEQLEAYITKLHPEAYNIEILTYFEDKEQWL